MPDSPMQRVLDYVRDHPGCKTAEVAKAVHQRPDSAGHRLNALYAFGYIDRQKDLLTDQPTRWFPGEAAYE